MYAGPDIIQPAGSIQAKRYAFTSIAAILLLSLILFIVAATIVLALIPVYLKSKSATLSSKATRSKVFAMYVALDQTATGGRKRAAGDVSSAVGGTFGQSALGMVGTTLLSSISDLASGVTVSSVDIAYQGSRRRRSAFSKRQTGQTAYMVIKGYITFLSTCFGSCQTTTGVAIRQRFYSMAPTSFSYTNVPIYKSGAFYGYVTRIQSTAIYYVTEILGALSSATEGPVPATATATTATTTPVFG